MNHLCPPNLFLEIEICNLMILVLGISHLLNATLVLLKSNAFHIGMKQGNSSSCLCGIVFICNFLLEIMDIGWLPPIVTVKYSLSRNSVLNLVAEENKNM